MWFLVPVVLGQREAAINVAEGKKQSQILASEARRMEQINIATGNQLHLICYQNLNLNMLVLSSRRWQKMKIKFIYRFLWSQYYYGKSVY